MIPNHADVSDLLARWARERPAATALTFGGTRRTWAELAERSGASLPACAQRASNPTTASQC